MLLLAAGTVAVLHSILPDHWVPLAVVARAQRWRLLRVAWISALAAAGHVLTSVVLGGVVALVGLQFQRQIDTQQGHIVGGVLIVTGLGFLLWGLAGHSHSHDAAHDQHAVFGLTQDATPVRPAEAGDPPRALPDQRPMAKRLAAIVVPFGVAASPDLTILPVALAASAVGSAAVAGVLVVFACVTLATFIGLTVLATLAGYQIKGEWLERHATTITSLVLIAIGIVAYVGL